MIDLTKRTRSGQTSNLDFEPIRNVYLRSELKAFLAALATIAGNSQNDEYRRGWTEALTAMAMLVQVDMDDNEDEE